jgi:hypothetical protein
MLISEDGTQRRSAVEVAKLAGYKNGDPAMVYQHVGRGNPVAGTCWRWEGDDADGDFDARNIGMDGYRVDPWGSRILRTTPDDAEYTPFVFGPDWGPFQDWQPVNPYGPGILGREVGLPRRHYAGAL